MPIVSHKYKNPLCSIRTFRFDSHARRRVGHKLVCRVYPRHPFSPLFLLSKVWILEVEPLNFRIQTTTFANFEPYTEANYNPIAGGKSRLADVIMCVTSMFQDYKGVQIFLEMQEVDMGYANSQDNVNQRVLMERIFWLSENNAWHLET